MEALILLQSLPQLVEIVRNTVKGDKKLEVELKNDLESIKEELAMVSSKVETVLGKNNQDSKPPEWILRLQDLAYDIEDFLEVLAGRNPRAYRSLRLFQLAATIVIDPRPDHLRRIQQFKSRIKNIREGAAAAPSPIANELSTPSSSAQSWPGAQQLEGIEQRKRELADLLISTAGGHQNELKVISILGRGGSGKTTLVRALQDHSVVQKRFHYRAIVEAPSCSDPKAAAKTIVQSVLQQLGCVGEGDQLEILRDFLCDKRYLITIDGLQQRNVWDKIRPAFFPAANDQAGSNSQKNEQGSRIVVTTSIRSVAISCSAGSYVYAMRGLSAEESKDLFWSKLGNNEPRPSPAVQDGLETFFDKCDGLPILLVGTAECLRPHGASLTHKDCEDVGDCLGKHLAGEDPAFLETRRALTQCCGGLRERCEKMCMFSLSSFPRGHKINRKSLLRRWISEGLVDEDRDARNCMEKLLDLGIVEPVPSSCTTSNISCSKARSCQVHSVMLEFLVHRSTSWDFITVLDSGKVFTRRTAYPVPVRRLSIYGCGNHQDQFEQKIVLDRIRSLTIRNTSLSDSGGRLTLDLLELEQCKLLRVLDLEGCTWFVNEHFRAICRLLHLKYVSLRSTKVSKIPRAIRDLQCLETLDVRDTGFCHLLPIQVLLLPRLAHLFGEFELPAQLGDAKSKRAEKLRRFLSDESKLQTLSGFKIINNGGFELILRHAKELKKVKIWCECEAHPPKRCSTSRNPICALPLANRLLRSERERDPIDLPKSLVNSVLHRSAYAGSNALDSLSIDFGSNSLCTDFLASVLKDPCGVRYIKVRGEMEKLPDPQTLSQLRNVKELHLCNTGLSSVDLSALQNMDRLVSLKLEENHQGYWEGTFVVEPNGFQSLQLLCFDGPKLPNVEFKKKAMPWLISLRLICTEPAEDLAVTGIAHLPHLNDIILHPLAPEAKIQAWEDEAAKHRNRPYVKKQPKDV